MPPSPPNSVTGLARTFDGIVHRPRSSHRPASASLSAAAASPCPLDTSAPRPSASLLARPPAAGRPPAPRPTPFNWDLGALPTTTSRHYIPYVLSTQLANSQPQKRSYSAAPPKSLFCAASVVDRRLYGWSVVIPCGPFPSSAGASRH